MTPKEIAENIIEAGCELEPMGGDTLEDAQWIQLNNTDRLDSETQTAYCMKSNKVMEILLEDYQNAENYR